MAITRALVAGISASLLVRACLAAALHEDSQATAKCEERQDCDHSPGSSLLQVQGHKEKINRHSQDPPRPSSILPAELADLGVAMFGNLEAVDAIVAATQENTIAYGGVQVKLRTLASSNAHKLFEFEGQTYGLETLRNVTQVGMMQMLDLGGNYGVVSIAAYKLYPQQMHVVTVEPLPSTFFILCWNLWLNGVPQLATTQPSNSPGVIALNKAVDSSHDQVLEFCYNPPVSVAAFVCKCAENPAYQCMSTSSIRMEDLLAFFPNDITMVKMDCEGCESYGLPVLARIMKDTPARIGRLVGELHLPGQELEAMACECDNGRGFFQMICPSFTADGKPTYDARELQCGKGQPLCEASLTPQHGANAKALVPKYSLSTR